MKKKSRKKETSRLRNFWDSLPSEKRLALLSKTGRTGIRGSWFAKHTWNEMPNFLKSDLGIARTGKSTREAPSAREITIPDYIKKQCPYFNKDVKQNTSESRNVIIKFPNNSNRKSDEQQPPEIESFSHIDPQIERAIIQLNDVLCEFERTSGQQILLMLIPENPDEQMMISQNGKPLPPGMLSPEEALAFTMKLRREE